MSALKSSAIKTWFRDEAEEEGMHDDHAYLWRHMVRATVETDYSQFTVLDYGCNRGGFLNDLFRYRPFQRAIGVDVAELSLANARKQNAQLLADFILPEQMQAYADEVDIAFSHEVLYLLPDLQAHAAAIAATLKHGASYYAAIGCHIGNPLWLRWRQLIAETTNLPVFDYSLDDYARAFWKSGLRVEMKPYQLQEFILIKPDNAYFPKAADSIDYHTNVKTLIRAQKVK